MRLYLSDLDGTLLNYKAEITPFTREVLNRELKNGTAISYATARSVHSAAPIMEGVDIKLPVITHNGAFIIDPISKKRLVSHFFDDKKKKFLQEFFSEHKEALLVYSVVNNHEKVSYLTSRLNKGTKRYIKERKNDKRLNPCQSYDELFLGDIYYITLIEPKTELSLLDDNFCGKNGFARNYQADTYDTQEYWYEIYDGNVSKANAALELKKLVGADELICFGDNLNDISMFKAADRSYAVSNAAPELKKYATGIIRSNNQSGVPIFISDDNTPIWRYEKQPFKVIPDNSRFKECVSAAEYTGEIGTLNEKQTHKALKSYFASTAFDKEIKIGSYCADLVTENGIFEIQTKSFGKLREKLNVFLQASHVTVVYPFVKKRRLSYINSDTGEVIKTGNFVTLKDMSNFFLELYRIKQYLNNPNLTICIADLTVENFRYCKEDMKRRKSDRKTAVPTDLTRLTYIEDSESYRCFLPKGLPEKFTVKDFADLCEIGDPTLIIKALSYVGIVDFAGKQGGSILYKVT